MTVLRELNESGRRKVERTLEEGDPVGTIDDDTFRQCSVQIDGVTADLEALREDLQEIIDDCSEYSVEIDARAAPKIRQHIDISRRAAANDGLWHWLCSAKFDDFVYSRWKESGDIQEKFLGAGTNIYSNALHRLWWGAELTHDGTYELTEAMFSSGELANDVLDRWFARYRPAARVTVECLQDESSDIISDTTTDLRNELSGYSLELMEEEEIEALLERL